MTVFKIVDFEYVGDKRIGAMRYQGDFDSLADAIRFARKECNGRQFDIVNPITDTVVYQG